MKEQAVPRDQQVTQTWPDKANQRLAAAISYTQSRREAAQKTSVKGGVSGVTAADNTLTSNTQQTARHLVPTARWTMC